MSWTSPRIAVAVAFLAAALLSAPAWAAEDAVVREAKKEGKVMWYTSIGLPDAQALCNKFNAKKLGVECIVHRDGSGKIYQRYLQEAKGNIYVGDVLHTSNAGHFLNLQEKHLLKYNPRGIEKFDPKFVNKDGRWHILRAGVTMPFYNTKKISAADAPKSHKDILNPKWKDRLVHSHPSYSAFVTNSMVHIVRLYGEDYYKKLAALKPKVVQSAIASIPLVSRGEADLGSGTTSYTLFQNIKKGEPLKPIFAEEGMALVTSPNGILTKAPHPNAAKVFADFLFSQEAQQLLADRFLYVGHPDVKYPEGMPAPKDLKLKVLDPEEVKKMNKPIQEMFRKYFGV